MSLQEEFDRIEKIPDLTEQGYQCAPLIYKKLQAAHPDLPRELILRCMAQCRTTDGLRDTGVIAWCKDQKRSGLRVVK